MIGKVTVTSTEGRPDPTLPPTNANPFVCQRCKTSIIARLPKEDVFIFSTCGQLTSHTTAGGSWEFDCDCGETVDSGWQFDALLEAAEATLDQCERSA